MATKKALVVGGTGPTGPFIVDGLLDRSFETVVLHRGLHEVPFKQEIEHIHVDPHFETGLRESLKGRTFDVAVVTYGRLNLIAECLKGCTGRVVSIGGTAFAPDPSDRPWSEKSPRPAGIKIIDKIVSAEEKMMALHESGAFNVSHFRYPNLYGPRQLAPKEWSVIRRIQDGRRVLPMMDGGLTLESRAYVENAAAAVLLAVDKPEASAGQIYNVADEHTPSDVVRARKIAQLMRVEVEFISFPRSAGRPAHYWGRGRDLETGTRGEPPPTAHRLLDVGKMVEELGYRDPVPFETAMDRTVEWYLANPLERGGDEERVLGDPFDYAAEDEFIRLQREFVTACERLPFAGVKHAHSYDHPKEAAKVVGS
jgi:nucleoside-diphosphate-sugar epimerase